MTILADRQVDCHVEDEAGETVKGTALVYEPGRREPDVIKLDRQPGLDWFQEHVGGFIESVPRFDRIMYEGKVFRCLAFCNEEGKLKNLPFNETATELWDVAMHGRLRRVNGSHIDVLVGPIVVVFGDYEFMREL